MKCSIISYGIIENDGRLEELIATFNLLGNTKVICLSRDTSTKDTIKIKGKYLSLWNYLRFLLLGLKEIIILKKGDYLLVDNFFAAPLGRVAHFIKPKVFLAQDCRECYSVDSIASKAGRFLVKQEISLMKKADAVIEANEERAKFVFGEYSLKKKPIVFENIRFLPTQQKPLSAEMLDFFANSGIKVISTGGVSEERGSLSLIESFSRLSSDFSLLIVGGGYQKDLDKARELIAKLHLDKRVFIIGRIPLEALSTAVSHSDIGVVHYHKKDFNNIYCASGKVYEFIGCGLPIVASDNESLKNICQKHQIGIAGVDFAASINMVYQKYDYYKKNVEKLKAIVSPEKNRAILADVLRQMALRSGK